MEIRRRFFSIEYLKKIINKNLFHEEKLDLYYIIYEKKLNINKEIYREEILYKKEYDIIFGQKKAHDGTLYFTRELIIDVFSELAFKCLTLQEKNPEIPKLYICGEMLLESRNCDYKNKHSVRMVQEDFCAIPIKLIWG